MRSPGREPMADDKMLIGRAREILAESPRWLLLGGIAGFLLLGAVGGLMVISAAYTLTIGVTLPTLIAIIVGATVVPLVDKLEQRGVKRVIGAPMVMVLLAAVVIAAAIAVVKGLIAQWPAISQQIQSGFAALGDSLSEQNVPPETVASIEKAVRDAVPSIAQGIGAILGGSVSSIAMFLFGVFIAFYVLFYILKDYGVLSAWAGSHLGLPKDVGVGIIDDGARSLRGYFKGQTVVAATNTVVIVAGLLLFNVPLVGPIAIVTFVFAYIPYLGAIISGTFAVLIALSSGGVPAALGILVVVLVSQNLVQTPVSNWAVGGQLNLHPVAVLLVTMLGGVIAGALGATLAAPLTSVSVQTGRRLKDLRESSTTPTAERTAGAEDSPQ